LREGESGVFWQSMGERVESFEGAVATRFWRRLEDGRSQCDVCPRLCRLRPGQRGLCFVRAADESGAIVLTTWGRSSGFCVDPIEKKPLNHYLPGTAILSFGTAGCNLACSFCQNWDISKSRDWDRLSDRADPETIAGAAEALGCRAVAFTYNDPTIFLEYAGDVADACRARGVAAVAVSAGYILPEPRRELYAHLDAANIDLKAFTEEFYRKVCGGHLAPVLDTLVFLRRETSVWFEITTLLIPGQNDSEAEIAAECEWIAGHLGTDVPLHFTAFHPDWRMLDTPPTPPATLTQARRIALDRGLKYVYTGNVRDPEGSATWCPGCGGKLIGRDGYTLTTWRLDAAGRCEKCSRALPGRFEALPGSWGNRRQPVRLADFAAGSG
jgi:pyruvate formate lyase activating enzyme